ncbi:MAG: hypothetical protein J0I09_01205 [Sphingobacteriia bacterium]|nr:hypothetical protein [Sphingobacteriia bacterium]
MRLSLFALLILCMAGCKSKKPSLAGEDKLNIKDFTGAFAPLNLPFTAADTNLTKIADTTIIGIDAIRQFVADSVLQNHIPNYKKVLLHPVGIIKKQKEYYLLLTGTTFKKTQLLVFVFDEKNQFIVSKQLLTDDNKNDAYHRFVSINKEPTFLISKEKTDENKQLRFTRVGWVYSSNGKKFMVVINDGNEDPKKEVVINPIDTLPKKNKWSGNYIKDSKNFISIRDGRDANNYIFFIHFEKKEGNCSGELKGNLKLKDATNAIYAEGGDPCVINFTISGNEIVVKEKGSCGNRRGLDCLFDDSYTKKKEVVKKKK